MNSLNQTQTTIFILLLHLIASGISYHQNVFIPVSIGIFPIICFIFSCQYKSWIVASSLRQPNALIHSLTSTIFKSEKPIIHKTGVLWYYWHTWTTLKSWWLQLIAQTQIGYLLQETSHLRICCLQMRLLRDTGHNLLHSWDCLCWVDRICVANSDSWRVGYFSKIQTSVFSIKHSIISALDWLTGYCVL